MEPRPLEVSIWGAIYTMVPAGSNRARYRTTKFPPHPPPILLDIARRRGAIYRTMFNIDVVARGPRSPPYLATKRTRSKSPPSASPFSVGF